MLDDPANREFFKVTNWPHNLCFVLLFRREHSSLKIERKKEKLAGIDLVKAMQLNIPKICWSWFF